MLLTNRGTISRELCESLHSVHTPAWDISMALSRESVTCHRVRTRDGFSVQSTLAGQRAAP